MGEKLEDEHGQYDSEAGKPHPLDEDEVNYTPCNAVLKFTFDRYGERRYCTGMAEENFVSDGSRFCRHHKSREALMKQRAKTYKTGAYTKSHQHKFQYIDPHEKIIANDIFTNLLEESSYSFDATNVDLDIDVSDTEFAPDADTLVLDHPVPQEHETRGKALWHASLDFVTMESIREEQFRVSAEEEHEGRELAIGETTTIVDVDDNGRTIEDTDEHHLNIALSRIQKTYKEHMKFGGVDYDGETNSGGMSERTWVATVQPDEPDPQPEAQTGATSPISDIETPSLDE